VLGLIKHASRGIYGELFLSGTVKLAISVNFLHTQEKQMSENLVVVQNITVDNNFTSGQVQALRNAFEAYENRIADLEATAASFGDLSAANANDTLVSDANGVFQVNAVP